jgi:hypothetical protein
MQWLFDKLTGGGGGAAPAAGAATGSGKDANAGDSIGGSIMSGLKSIFRDMPIWLGEIIISGFKQIFIDFPIMIFESIASGISMAIDFLINPFTMFLKQYSQC